MTTSLLEDNLIFFSFKLEDDLKLSLLNFKLPQFLKGFNQKTVKSKLHWQLRLNGSLLHQIDCEV